MAAVQDRQQETTATASSGGFGVSDMFLSRDPAVWTALCLQFVKWVLGLQDRQQETTVTESSGGPSLQQQLYLLFSIPRTYVQSSCLAQTS